MKADNLFKKLLLMTLVFTALALSTSCNKDLGDDGVKNTGTYQQITQAEAKRLMDTESDFIIIDARTQEEYDEGHIEGAILIPEYEISYRAEELLKNKDQLILVYCRSGRRSKIAAQALADLGYTNVKEFGGIITWIYGTVK